MVKVMSGMGIREDQMVDAILNPETKRPISPVTLRKHFREELNQGFVQALATVGASLFKNATTATDTYPGGNPITQMFYLKCRGRWQQNPERNPLPVLVDTEGTEADDRETVRRLAFALAKEAAQTQKEEDAKKLPSPKRKHVA